MLKDFSKINTFLTVVREKSFSRASKKLGISQPAVTQQIKLLEGYIKAPIVDRKKNGIGLTKEGKELYKVAQKLEKFLSNLEKEVLRIMDKKITFVIGASNSIGKYMVPCFLGDIKEAIGNDVSIKLGTSSEVLALLADKKVDLALVRNVVPNNSILFREWISDELVLCSKAPLPPYLKKDQLLNYNWLMREDDSLTYNMIISELAKQGVEYEKFDIASEVSSSTTIKQTLLRTPISKDKKPLIAFLSKYAVKDSVDQKELNISRVKGLKFKTKLYVACLKDDKQDAFVDRVVNYIMTKCKM
ncbi:MAG: LysR family transcriptional regulator [Proteobacteria bacterium]|nr:MAG: LysR family transcriptional regulator [Pseudomonadota bacterium]